MSYSKVNLGCVEEQTGELGVCDKDEGRRSLALNTFSTPILSILSARSNVLPYPGNWIMAACTAKELISRPSKSRRKDNLERSHS